MATTQKRMDAANPVGWESIQLSAGSVGANQAAVVFQNVLVPFAFQVLFITAWAQVVTATAQPESAPHRSTRGRSDTGEPEGLGVRSCRSF